VNAYRHFSGEVIWPRGLPLDWIHAPIIMGDRPGVTLARNAEGAYWCPIQQGLADGSPDVDAIWRLVLDREFRFQRADSVCLPPGQWCPFNTQSTWWWPAAYPLLYIPSYCSFRMCDIWKSLVAQRCLWEFDAGLVFHGPEVWQDRNAHQLMRDFADEVPGYLENHRLASVLERSQLRPGCANATDNLIRCYEALIAAKILPAEEMQLVRLWGEGLEKAQTHSA
jgi:hypothetical protein